MTHNEVRIHRYKEEAIAALRQLSTEDDIESFDAAINTLQQLSREDDIKPFNAAVKALNSLPIPEGGIDHFDAAVRALRNMQPYLNLSAKNYAIR